MTKFRAFLHVYQQSNSFNVGFFNKDIHLGVKASRVLSEVYEEITAEGDAVDSATNWWGFYEFSLPPAFLLESRLDPIFRMAKKSLLKSGVPKCEVRPSFVNLMKLIVFSSSLRVSLRNSWL